jgi:hypothetical protein
MPVRYDSGAIKKWETTPQGGVRLDAALTRVGVFTYRLSDGTSRREFRPPEEVFHPEALRSLRLAPVTELHPDVPVTADNWRALAVGVVGEDVQVENQSHVVAQLAIQDSGTIKRIDAGDFRELSCGYQAELDPTPGEWNGERFDAIQRGIRYNHVALGPTGWGRAGSTVALRLDSGDAIQEEDTQAMFKITIDGKEHTVGTQAELEALATKLLGERDTAKGRADSLTSKVDTLTKELEGAKDPKALALKVKARADLLMTARKVAASKGVKLDEEAAEALTDTDFMAKIIKLLDPSFDPAGKSPDYIRGAFETTIMGLVGGQGAPAPEPPKDGAPPAPPPSGTPGPLDSIFSTRDSGSGTRKDGTGQTPAPDAEVSRLKMVEANRNAWKIPEKRPA